jgi:hypothetical protein
MQIEVIIDRGHLLSNQQISLIQTLLPWDEYQPNILTAHTALSKIELQYVLCD